MGYALQGLLGMVCLLALSYLLSENRKRINWRLVAVGMISQFILSICVLKLPFVRTGFASVSDFLVRLLSFSEEGTRFLLGDKLMDTNTFGYIFAFRVLPVVIFFSALTSLLYYLGVLQKIVYVFAWGMNKTMKLSGAESLAAAGNIFMGQTEAPLLIRPFIEGMTRSEIMCLMTGGMATIAGSVFGAFVGFLGGSDPVQQQLFAMHLLTASVMSAPAAIVASKMIVPETEPVNKSIQLNSDKNAANLLDSIAVGTFDGARLAINVGVMLLVFTALVVMVNYFLTEFVGTIGGNYLNNWAKMVSGEKFDAFNLQFMLGTLLAPVAWLLGVPVEDMQLVGQLLGEKTIINEFYAYKSLSDQMQANMFSHQRSIIISTYALCGFANFASIGIQIGGIGTMAPSKRPVLSQLGLKSMIAGTMACFYTAIIAGIMI